MGADARNPVPQRLQHLQATVSTYAGGHLTRLVSRNIVSCMRRDSRLSGVLHVLLHMAQKDGPMTSEVLAKAMNTNPVVLRRALAGLRDQGYVQSEKGHGGGWILVCDLAKVTLRDIYTALGSPSLLAIGNRTEKAGCVVDVAANGAEALERIAARDYDLVFMDCQMPIMDGYEATKRIRQGRLASVPIVAMTAHAMKGDRERCLAVGMTDYLSKPLKSETVAEMVERVLRVTA